MAWPMVAAAAISAAGSMFGGKQAAGAQQRQLQMARGQRMGAVALSQNVQQQLFPYMKTGLEGNTLLNALMFGISPLSGQEQEEMQTLSGNIDEYRKEASLLSARLGAAKPRQAKELTPRLQALQTKINRLEELQAKQKVSALGETPQEILEGTPGYQFRFGLGEKATVAGRSVAGLRSGSTLKALTEYGQSFATEEYNQAISRAMGLTGLGMQSILPQYGITQTLAGGGGKLSESGQGAMTQQAGDTLATIPALFK
jgi:hypothetical protein